MRIDLHTHTTASDGTDTPAELMRAAAAAGLDIVAITDHDTTSGWVEAAEAVPSGLRLVRGIEMSCAGRGEDGRPVPVHLLAYLFDPDNEAFALERGRLRDERTTRVRRMAELMAADGLPIDPDEILAGVGAAAGRPHLARALVREGVVASAGDAFKTLLSARGPYYVAKKDTPLGVAVAMVASAGGVSVLAHGRARSRGRLLSLEHIREVAGSGLNGLEIDHIDHTDEDRKLLIDLANELNLISTGSSDYHGTNKSVRLGMHTTDPNQFEAIVATATGVEVLSG